MDPQDFFDTAAEELQPPEPGGGDAASSLIALLERKGLAARIVPVERAYELRAEIDGRVAKRELDEELYARYAGEFTFEAPADFHDVQSIVIAAVPRPQTAAVFHVGGAARTLLIPPTYTDYAAVAASCVSWLRATLAKAGYRVAPASVPYKLLATRSGLAAYGRNNITFVPGLGSFFELVAAFTNIPCTNAEWHAPRMLDRCVRCRACVNRCPTSAIRLDRFLLESGRCLVFHNERAGAVAFPDWIDASAHRTVIGCMECQRVCPENRDVKGWVGAAEDFSERETAMLLAGTDAADLPRETLSKLERLDAVRFLNRLPRNLRAALARGM